uniref:Uncharacterized protein n=1 Tax=Leptobrachium leishanense TaxID=445787 RepID=A0A8C5PAB4_9ANUR
MSARRPTGQKKRAAASVTHPHTPALTGSSPMRHYLRGSQAVSSQGRKAKMAAAGDRMVESEDDLQDSRTSSLSDIPTAEVRETLRHLPTKRDLESLFSRFEAKFDAKFAELGADVRQLGGRVQDLEEDRDASMAHLDRLQAQINEQSRYVTDLRRSVDDLDNRGRRNNVRIRGVPESEDTEDIPLTLRTLFNALLERPPDRALRPRGAPSAPPRDIICRIHHFPLKEEIMQAARKKRSITHDGHAVEVYQDLSRFTLQARRHLKPITDVLRDRDIRYRWGYPFALTVRRDNQLMSIMEPGDVPEFICALDLPQVEVTNWHGGDLLDFPLPSPNGKNGKHSVNRSTATPSGMRQQTQDSTRPLARRGRTPEKFSPSLWSPTPPSTVLANYDTYIPRTEAQSPREHPYVSISLVLLFFAIRYWTSGHALWLCPSVKDDTRWLSLLYICPGAAELGSCYTTLTVVLYLVYLTLTKVSMLRILLLFYTIPPAVFEFHQYAWNGCSTLSSCWIDPIWVCTLRGYPHRSSLCVLHCKVRFMIFLLSVFWSLLMYVYLGPCNMYDLSVPEPLVMSQRRGVHSLQHCKFFRDTFLDYG